MRRQTVQWIGNPITGLMAVFVMAFLGVTSCFAQEKSEDVLKLGAMTVTAQKTEEKTFDVPMALSVFNDTSMEDKNLTDLEDLSYLVPNFFVLNVGDFGPYKPTMRGLNAEAAGLGTSVGLYIDGAATHTGLGFNTRLDDIERVEVLRGPQGTLYGSGSEAGVINVITKKPGNETEGKISLEYGEDNKHQIGMTYRTPIVNDLFYVGLTGRYYAKDGFIENEDGDTVDDRQNYFGKIYLRATPSEQLELSLISSLYQSDDGGLRRNKITADDERTYGGDLDEEIKNRYETHSLNVSYKFDSFNLSSTTVYSNSDLHSYLDVDYSQQKLYHYDTTTPIESMSEEVKIDGEHGKLKWLLGLFAGKAEKSGGWDSESDNTLYQYTEDQVITEESMAIFGHMNYDLTDQVSLLAGVRFDRSKASFDDEVERSSGVKTEYDDSKNFSSTSPKFAVEFKPNESIMTYLTVSKGYLMGGYYSRTATGYSKDYDSETLWNYELGMKSRLLDDKLLLNADIFYMNITDMQTVSYISLNQSYMSNAAKASTYGIEMDANYVASEALSFFCSLGFTEAKYNEFEDFKGDYEGNYQPFVPKYSYSLGGKYRGQSGFFASMSAKGYGLMYLDNANEYEKDPYTLIDAKVGYEFSQLDVYLYADNLTDVNYDMEGYQTVYTLMNSPREVGVNVTYRF